MPPTGSPSSSDIRAAAARAASLRGSATTIRPVIASAMANGTMVVFPVPGGAINTAVPWSVEGSDHLGQYRPHRQVG